MFNAKSKDGSLEIDVEHLRIKFSVCELFYEKIAIFYCSDTFLSNIYWFTQCVQPVTLSRNAKLIKIKFANQNHYFDLHILSECATLKHWFMLSNNRCKSENGN